MPRRLRAIATSETFQDAILALIVLNGLCAGVEAIPGLADRYQDLLFWVFAISQAVFVAEIAIRLLACWPAVRDFFRDGWNTFDFAIVALSLLPAIGGLTLTARLLRLLRLLRVVSMSDTLRGLAGGQPTLALPAVLVVLVNYLLVLAGFHLFAELDPDGWSDLGRAIKSLGALARPDQAGAVIASLSAQSAWSVIYVTLVYLVNLCLLASAVLVLRGQGSRSPAALVKGEDE